ncbi:MAG: extracellular solute-binding protein [Planctomycetes bacterium]|nr:extracellular solute-binding protein [Planctomycetota bacterium]
MSRSRRLLRLAPFCLVATVTAQDAVDAAHAPPQLVLFTSVGERVVRPAVAPFEQATGIDVQIRRVPRRTGPAAAELLREFDAAHGDIWWCQETLTTDALCRAGAFAKMEPPPAAAAGIDVRYHDADGMWFGFAARARILMINTDLVPGGARPRSMWDLLDARWRGKVVLARPTSGTTLFHLLALQDALGRSEAERFLDGLARNDCLVASGDGQLAAMIGAGQAALGLTDTSDCRNVELQGKPVAMVYPDQDGPGTMVIPHTLALLASSRQRDRARTLIEHLLSPQTEALLAQQDRGQLPLHPGTAHPAGVRGIDEFTAMRVDLGRAAALADSLGACLIERYAPPPAAGDYVGRANGTVVVDFDTMRAGQPPTGMSIGQTGDGQRGVWTVTDDPTSHGAGRVVTQTDASDLGHRFPLCIYDGLQAADISVRVNFKTMVGDSDRAAGLLVRYQDDDNYYCCRVNSLEDNYRFYKVEGGRRIELGGVDRCLIQEDVWQSMRLDANGNHFSIWLNGALVFEVDDPTFTRPGKVGLWLKGDSITSFDDLTISPPGKVRASDFEGDALGAAPPQLTAVSGDDAAIAWRVVDAAGHGGGRAVTPDPSTSRRATTMLLDEARSSDVSVATRFKVATTGPGMHLAGIVVRHRDEREHYYLRINLEECNLRLYRVREGRRQLIGERHHLRCDDHLWHSARVTAVGSRFEVLLDGELQFAAIEPGPAVAGRAGIWASPGGGTLYDELSITRFE